MKPFHVADLPSPTAGQHGWPWTNENTSQLSAQRSASEWPLISIVTPSYNQGRFLEETIRSVLMQGYPNLEYIVIDGGSKDNSVEIIKEYAPFLDYWISEPDNGQANAINKGLVRCTGAIMGWLNSDDLLMPDALFHIAQAFITDPDTTLICGLRKIIDVNSHFKRNWICDLPANFYMLKDCVVAQETVYWKRELFEQLGLLDESMHFALDYEYWLRMIQAGNHFRLLPHYLGIFREHDTSKSSTLHIVHAANLAVIFDRYVPEDNARLINGGITFEMGPSWLSRFQVIQQLCQTHLFDSASRAIAIVSLLSLPFVQILFMFRYHFLVFEHRFQTKSQIRWRTNLMAVGRASLKSVAWLGKVIWARAIARRPLCYIEADNALAHAEGLLKLPFPVENGLEPPPADGIFVRSGWLYLERNDGFVFRWLTNDGEIVITAPSGRYNTLYLTITCGPRYEAPMLDLQILDAAKHTIGEFSIQRSGTIAVPLPLTPRQNYTIVLHATQIAQPLSNDTRILTMSVSRIAWTPPQAPRRPAHEVARQAIRFEFDQPVVGTGWSDPERNATGWTVWMNSSEATITTWLLPERIYTIQFRVGAALRFEAVTSTVCRVNGQNVPLTMNIDDRGGFIFHGTIPADVVSLDPQNTLLSFGIDHVDSPKLLGLNEDPRFLGLNFDWIDIKPSIPEINPSNTGVPENQ